MDDRLEKLSGKILAFRQKEDKEQADITKEEYEADNMNSGIRAGAEMVVSIIAGVLIGLLLDNALGTKPWFLLIFIFGGILAGFLGVYRITQNFDSSVGYSRLQNGQKDDTKTPENEDN
ncbi:MAG: AtpZ/AtpI family protein [Rhodospirillales bacterium]|nr:AtpZ/AtpI family protein [Rhodospirillales bacterium]